MKTAIVDNLKLDCRALFSVNGSTAVVTAATGKLGRIHAEALASRGANLAICARNPQRLQELSRNLIKKYGVKVFWRSVDITSEREVNRFFREVYGKFKRIDILVNNAAILGSSLIREGKRFKAFDTSEELWRKIIEGNLSSAFIVSKIAAKYMRRQGYGKIINVSSVYGLFIDNISSIPLAAYDTSNGSLHTLTRELAVELAPYRICVNAIAPTYISIGAKGQKYKRIFEHWKRQTPMKRLGKAEDLKGAIIFLSAPASDFITGAIIAVDGGWAARGS